MMILALRNFIARLYCRSYCRSYGHRRKVRVDDNTTVCPRCKMTFAHSRRKPRTVSQ